MMTVSKRPSHRVVVADDSASFRSALVRFLAKFPTLQVIAEAADGEEALQVVEVMAPDILILDIQMPKMNGLEVLRHLQNKQMDMQVVVLSAHESSYSEQAIASGATFVTKGDIPQLVNALTTLTEME